ncbi:hypothetical protein FRC19_009161 [Serendipita sp. 401]|nr:hypothetical protein FRC18_011834 [Serendipita sp. 400]KAG8820095.1 hypothetical protein FRC19_009161 [Serendipita sp. 401]
MPYEHIPNDVPSQPRAGLIEIPHLSPKAHTVDALQKLLLSGPLRTLQSWSLSLSLNPMGRRNAKMSYIKPLIDSFLRDATELGSLSFDELATRVMAESNCSPARSNSGLIYQIL